MRRDPHSYADDSQVETASIALRATVDFATRTLAGDVQLVFATPGGGPLDLDTRDLTIERVVGPAGELPFTLHPAEPVLGARLAIELPAATPWVRVHYRTSPDAAALQWLEPAQTAGGVHPFLFSQCQAIHARSVVPLQDTPRIRIRYQAELTIPRALTAVMAARRLDVTPAGDHAIARFEMPQPIPPYLFALAVGDLAARDVGPRSQVWAEPAMLERAAREFADVERMIAAAEELFGPYDWERFDLLTMPPSFPYGGMENPRLTFVTPTVIAGDKSLVSVIVHELAHSWTGNLVTNANAEHFWLNEGFTVYAERRLLEVLYGADFAALHAAIGRSALDEAFARFRDRPELTHLRTRLAGVDPDEVFSLVPYEKGYSFLCALEQAAGRDAFTAWLRSYLRDFRFRSLATEDFVAHLEAALPGALARVDARAWLDGPGLPPSAPSPRSARLSAIEALGTALPPADASAWSPAEWQLYLARMPRPAPAETLRALDTRLTASTNFEVLVAWLQLALESGYHAVVPRASEVLASVGRMKYLRPLYVALAKDPATRTTARELFARSSASYHPIARQVIEGVLSARS